MDHIKVPYWQNYMRRGMALLKKAKTINSCQKVEGQGTSFA